MGTVTEVLTAIFGSPSYRLRGGGGDVCLPGAIGYQALHSDAGDAIDFQGIRFGSFSDPRGKLTLRDLPCPYVACNFLMVETTKLNGPTRQIPGTQHSVEPMPRLADEPDWMKFSTVVGVPAGAVLIRDVRAWHGGTPNVSDEIRAMPNVEFFAPWYHEPARPSLTRAHYETLSDHAKRVSRHCVLDSSKTMEIETVIGPTPPHAVDA